MGSILPVSAFQVFEDGIGGEGRWLAGDHQRSGFARGNQPVKGALDLSARAREITLRRAGSLRVISGLI